MNKNKVSGNLPITGDSVAAAVGASVNKEQKCLYNLPLKYHKAISANATTNNEQVSLGAVNENVTF